MDGVSPVCSTVPLETVKRVQKRAGVVTVDADDKTRGKRTFHEHRHTAATVMLTARQPLPALEAFEPRSRIAQRIAQPDGLEPKEAQTRI